MADNLEETVKKEGVGAGLAEGLMISFDPIGAVAQYVGNRMGYDIKTIGGLSLFGTEGGTKINRKELGASSWFGKGIGLACPANMWLNPLAWPYLIGTEAVLTVVNISGNMVRYHKQGNLRLDE